MIVRSRERDVIKDKEVIDLTRISFSDDENALKLIMQMAAYI